MRNLSNLKPGFLTLTTLILSALQTATQILRSKYLSFLTLRRAHIAVIPRRQCLYRCFNLNGIPPQARRQTLQLKINQWSPWHEPKTNIIWRGANAQVWCWQADDKDKKYKTIVETRYFPHPESTQLQLLACNEGYEAQYWQEGILKESHWWPDKPSEEGWQTFLRSAGLEAHTEIPDITVNKLPFAWGKEYRLDIEASLIALEANFWKTVPAALVFSLGWQGTQIYQIRQEINRQQQQQTELSQQIEPLLQTRNKMGEDQQYVDQVARLWQGNRQLRLLNEVITKLPDPSKMKIVAWEYQTEQLRFTIQTTNTDPSLFVQTYSNVEWGKDVSAQPDAKTGQITVLIHLHTNATV